MKEPAVIDVEASELLEEKAKVNRIKAEGQDSGQRIEQSKPAAGIETSNRGREKGRV